NPYDVRGGFLMGRWDNRISDTSSLAAQVSYTYSGLDTGYFAERRQTVDLDLTHQFRLTEGQDIVWGVGYRVSSDHTRKGFVVSLDLAAFYNKYDRLSSNEQGAPFLEPAGLPDHVVVPLIFDDLHKGATYGIEAVALWQPFERLRVQASYTLLRMNLQQGNSAD